MGTHEVVIETQAGEDRRILLLEAACRVLPQPDGVPVEGFHLVVVRAAHHVDVLDVLGVLVEEVLGRVLFLVRIVEVGGSRQAHELTHLSHFPDRITKP